MSNGEAIACGSSTEQYQLEEPVAALRAVDPEAIKRYQDVVVNGQWRQQAACLGKTALFCGPDSESNTVRRKREATAKQICITECPVRQECLTYVRSSPEPTGVYAGYGEGDRRDRRFYARTRR